MRSDKPWIRKSGWMRRCRWASACTAGLVLLTLATCAGPGPASAPARTRSPNAAVETASADQAAYFHWLERHSMLYQAAQLTPLVSGRGSQWQHEYAAPQPREVLQRASVWMLGYPGSVVTRPGDSVLASWADPELWKALDDIGIELFHTGPVKRSGGIVGQEYTPTIDGWFDRISLGIDPALGTEDEYRRMVQVAAAHHALIAGDLVPLHTGQGADFRLALRAYRDYPGAYTLVEIRREDWPLLPNVSGSEQTALISNAVAEQLTQQGYIPGRIYSADADPRVRQSSGWSATGPVVGADGKTRRWVYLHVFKPGQPALNWLDPSCAAQRIISGDIVRTITDLGAQVVRLDAVPFLGLERQEGTALASYYGHPLSILDTDLLAFQIRKLGGWSFQELNVPLKSLKTYMAQGPDLSYDFFTRTEVLHALLMRDAALLRMAYGRLLDEGVQPLRLVHDLQNHDEITYQLVGLDARGDETFNFEGHPITGHQLRARTLNEMRRKAAGEAAPYNLLYRPDRDGLATTFAGFVAACLGIHDLDRITPEQSEQIRRGHLLLACAAAMQPGVFSLSGWDLVGALPLPRASVEERLQDQDYRWINRGGIDLLGANPHAKQSKFGLPRAHALYGALPEQLRDPNSFASQLKHMLAVRKRYRLAEAELLAVPDVEHTALCCLALRLPGKPALAVTALNFSMQTVREELDLTGIPGVDISAYMTQPVYDGLNDQDAGRVSAAGKLNIELPGWSGATLIINAR